MHRGVHTAARLRSIAVMFQDVDTAYSPYPTTQQLFCITLPAFSAEQDGCRHNIVDWCDHLNSEYKVIARASTGPDHIVCPRANPRVVSLDSTGLPTFENAVPGKRDRSLNFGQPQLTSMLCKFLSDETSMALKLPSHEHSCDV